MVEQNRELGGLVVNYYLKVNIGNAEKVMHFHLQCNYYRFMKQRSGLVD